MQPADKPLQNSSRRFGLVVFDMDDTLFSEIDYVRSGYAVVADRLAQLTGRSAEDVLLRMWRHFACDRRTVFDAMLTELDLSNRLSVPALVDLYRGHLPRIRLRDEAPEVLACLRRGGIRLGVVTDGPLVMQQRKADALGLSRYIDRMIFTDSLPPGCAKPSPVAFQRLMDEFAVPPARCVYVADNPRKDFVGPRQLGWFTVQIVTDGGIYCGQAPPSDGQPHVQIRDFREVLSL